MLGAGMARELHPAVAITPADAKGFLVAVDAAIASHNAAIASLHVMRQLLIASVGREDGPSERPISAATEVAPITVAPTEAPANKRRSGRPRKHFPDRTLASTGAERVALSRKRRHVAKQVSKHTLSLEENISFLERESHVAKQVSQQVSGATPLPPDFQPDQRRAKLAFDQLGEAGAAKCLAKFRFHHEASGETHTPARWQAIYGKWVLNERPCATSGFATVSQRELPLMRDLGGGGVTIRQFSRQADAWEKYRGKTIPWGKSGIWPVPTEWPPGHEIERREAG